MILKNILNWTEFRLLTTTTHTTVVGRTRKHRTTTPDTITQTRVVGSLGPEKDGETPREHPQIQL
jgi:hypothetical protein